MRLLEEDESSAVMDAIDRIMLDRSINPFAYESLNTRILSGEEEGVFAWIAVNYLRGFFNDPEGNVYSFEKNYGRIIQILYKNIFSIKLHMASLLPSSDLCYFE